MTNVLLIRKPLLLACLLFMYAICFSQVTERWVNRQNGDANSFNQANGLVVDHGCVFVTGISDGIGTGADYATIRYNEDGTKKWLKRYNGPGNDVDEAVAIAGDDKGNVYVTGRSVGSGTGFDYATIKYDGDGNTKWVKRYNGPANGNDQAFAIAVDKDGNVYVTGTSAGSGTGTDIATIKYDYNGNTKWVKRYNGPGNGADEGRAITVDNNGNVYITGFSTGMGTFSDYTTIKYENDGDLSWVQRFNGAFNQIDIAKALAVDGNGNVYVTGFSVTSEGDNGDPDQIATIKYNAAGVQQWVSFYQGKSHNVGNAIAVDQSGNVYLTGVRGEREEDPLNDYVTIKYNTAGVQQWVSIFAGVGSLGAQGGDGATDLVLDATGNVYITGGVAIDDTFTYATVKYNTNGVQQWVATFTGPGAKAIGLDNYGNVYITGRTDMDYGTLKYNPAGVQQWVKKYNNQAGGPDRANALAVDKNGNILVTGGMTRLYSGLDYTTFKFDNNGDKIWKKTYDGPGNGADEASATAVDADGNVYVTGYSAGNGTGNDFATIKYDAAGNAKWTKRYNGPGNGVDEAKAIAVDKNGNVYVTGLSGGNGTGSDYATIKYDKDGNTKWTKRYNGPANFIDESRAIAVDGNGNVYVTGTSFANTISGDYATVKYDANGNQQWVARYDGPANFSDNATALVTDALGNVYVTGNSLSNVTGEDYATIKYNTLGVQQWVARFDHPPVNFGDRANAIAVDALGNVYVTGTSGDDYGTVKYNGAGVQQWAAFYNGPGNSFDGATALTVDAAGNVYVTGSSNGSSDFRNPDDYATIKYDAAGVQQWVARYDGAGKGSDVATAIALDNNGNVYVTGRSFGNGTNLDYATIKYEQAPLITAKSATSPDQNTVIVEREAAKLTVKAFPNAFTEFINLQWSGSNKTVGITITDAMGRVVEKRTGLAPAGTLQTGNRLVAGVYFAEIVQGTEKIVLKLVKQ
ncbi:hypothetical protein A4H97_11275 [Niastella yeongjuensis]|uniref:Secretion system C-terminal sorting domain-containing protein n=1 Tax=Niastella yeongjuensis TaxID=354355 RepID=A0A1V9E9G4_9BACT|nr:SBBP repeat-containing protein [Niastella yeongjuensis]OQP42739.1 hypothetical protein A4H97_11275 [Niastella yeongjuensis]SEO52028.1 delta-60 repeat domain-containing protein/Por secretion system C-terminal sorting domain-containing protein [Niastella yeongjuensis]